jgi:hypothetical protein
MKFYTYTIRKIYWFRFIKSKNQIFGELKKIQNKMI